MPFFGRGMSYASLASVWEKHWHFLETGPRAAPIFVGEFGTCGSAPTCVDDPRPGSQGLWFSYWLRYLREHPEIGWAFWAINGTNPHQRRQPDYILRPNWMTVRLPALIESLRDVESPPPPA
jgi:hypothetical protein